MKNENTFQFIAPPVPTNWNAEERQFYRALMDLMDRLFTMKIKRARIGELDPDSIVDGSITYEKLADDVGQHLNMQGNQSIENMMGGMSQRVTDLETAKLDHETRLLFLENIVGLTPQDGLVATVSDHETRITALENP